MIHNSFELDLLKRWALYQPNNVALREGESEKYFTYSALFQRVCTFAQHLKQKYNLQKEDRVLAICKNDIEYIALFFACQRLGVILVPVNFRFKSSEIEFVIKDSSPKLVIFDNEFEATISEIEHLSLQKVSFDDLNRESYQVKTKFLDFLSEPNSPAMILYTSGTTGFPKGAVISQQMIFWNSVNTSLRLNITSSDKTVIFLPLFHTGGWNVLTTPFLHHGAEITLIKKFDADLVLELCEKHKSTILFGVPTTMDLIYRSEKFFSSDLSRIRYAIVGGEPMPLELIEVWESRNIPIRQGYGLTEFGPNVFSLNQEDSKRKIGSIGFPNFYIDCKVINDKGEICLPNEIGELVLKGPMMMTGYWQNPKATNETIKDGWLHTGDLVRQDNEGYFYVVGRKKEMFISGGENVYPAEIERVLRGLKGVREAAVIGIKDPKWGEVGKAFITFEEGVNISKNEVENHCLNNLAKFKVPKEFMFLKELPKSDTGKVLKKVLQ